MWVGPSSIFENDDLKKTLHRKQVYVHEQGGHQYRIQAPDMNDSILVGTFILEDSVVIKETLQGQDLQKRNEVHFIIRDSISPDSNISSIKRSQVKEVAVYEDTDNTQTGKNVAAVFIVILIITVGLVVWAVTAIVNSFSEAVSGCYIATMVYGSYDAPEVMTLRNFRDEVLKKYFLGRLFISLYYLTSPQVVRLTKNSPGINRYFKKRLDKFVNRLHSRGIK